MTFFYEIGLNILFCEISPHLSHPPYRNKVIFVLIRHKNKMVVLVPKNIMHKIYLQFKEGGNDLTHTFGC